MSKRSSRQHRLPPRTARRGRFHDHLLTIVLVGLFVVSWIGQFVAQAAEVSADARAHGQAFTWAEFWPQFLSATFENWQSEFLQLFTFVLLTAYLIHRGSAESPDGDDETKAMLEELLARTERSDDAKVTVNPAGAPGEQFGLTSRGAAGAGKRGSRTRSPVSAIRLRRYGW